MVEDNSQARELEYTNLLDYFDLYLCPLAISMGMSAKSFWEDDPDYFWNYCDAKKITDENLYNNMNYSSYLSGVYNMYATAQNLTTKKKNIYPSKPLNIGIGDKSVNEQQRDSKWKAFLFNSLNFKK